MSTIHSKVVVRFALELEMLNNYDKVIPLRVDDHEMVRRAPQCQERMF